MREFVVQARPIGQAVPVLYACRRFQPQHGGRWTTLRRQAHAWLTRRAAEKWMRSHCADQSSNPIYGIMECAVVEEGQEEVPAERQEFVFVDGQHQRQAFVAESSDRATTIAREHKLKVIQVKYRIAQQTVLGDYRQPRNGTRRDKL